jgi:RNA polymerase sporulation-specific sigma factor
MILGECRRYLRDNNSIRVSRSLRDIAYKAIYAKENLQKTKDKEPTIEEIAKEICIPAEDILMSLDAISAPLSLYEPVFQEGGDTLYIMDQIKDAKCKEDLWVNNLDLQDGLDRLCDRERAIINLRFFEGRTQMEVAEEVGISQAQVSRLEKNAIKYLKKYLKEENG